MRGTLPYVCDDVYEAGLIPTYAGNTRAFLRLLSGSRAHPHVCGEHTRSESDIFTPPGSSPRMRGTRAGLLHFGAAAGLIPTYAGNTFQCQSKPHHVGGSSPRMRGTPSYSGARRFIAGLIPTYAGNTTQRRRKPNGTWAHPHVCGEHVFRRLSGSRREGSSPRMRGTPF